MLDEGKGKLKPKNYQLVNLYYTFNQRHGQLLTNKEVNKESRDRHIFKIKVQKCLLEIERELKEMKLYGRTARLPLFSTKKEQQLILIKDLDLMHILDPNFKNKLKNNIHMLKQDDFQKSYLNQIRNAIEYKMHKYIQISGGLSFDRTVNFLDLETKLKVRSKIALKTYLDFLRIKREKRRNILEQRAGVDSQKYENYTVYLEMVWKKKLN